MDLFGHWVLSKLLPCLNFSCLDNLALLGKKWKMNISESIIISMHIEHIPSTAKLFEASPRIRLTNEFNKKFVTRVTWILFNSKSWIWFPKFLSTWWNCLSPAAPSHWCCCYCCPIIMLLVIKTDNLQNMQARCQAQYI